MADIGLTHVALTSTNLAATIAFYQQYANMSVVHRRSDAATNKSVVWLSDRTRPFVIVLLEVDHGSNELTGFAHLGVGCESREEVDRLCEQARREGRGCIGPNDYGYPVGYWAFIVDPDGHNLEVSYGQEVGLAVARSNDQSGTG